MRLLCAANVSGSLEGNYVHIFFPFFFFKLKVTFPRSVRQTGEREAAAADLRLFPRGSGARSGPCQSYPLMEFGCNVTDAFAACH